MNRPEINVAKRIQQGIPIESRCRNRDEHGHAGSPTLRLVLSEQAGTPSDLVCPSANEVIGQITDEKEVRLSTVIGGPVKVGELR